MKTITVICEDHAGVLFEIAEALKRRGINLSDITAHGLGELGAVVISATGADHAKAVAELRRLGYTPMVQDSLVVRMKDRPGELAKVTRVLKKSGINILAMRILSQEAGYAYAALSTDHPKKTRALLKEFLVK